MFQLFMNDESQKQLYKILDQARAKIMYDYRGNYKSINDPIKFEEAVYQAIDDILKHGSDNSSLSCMYLGGHQFPDIILSTDNYKFGVEVKKTSSASGNPTLCTNGNSILGTTRQDSLDHVVLFFGAFINNGKNLEIIIKSYSECVTDVKITHSPRFYIDLRDDVINNLMKLELSYDEITRSDDPIALFQKKYLKNNTDKDDIPWWIGFNKKDDTILEKMQCWNDFEKPDKEALLIECLVTFPYQIVTGDYKSLTQWLILNKNVYCANVRDMFSSGGQIQCDINNEIIGIPKIFKIIEKHYNSIKQFLRDCNSNLILWNEKGLYQMDSNSKNRLKIWQELVFKGVNKKYEKLINPLTCLLNELFLEE